MKIRVTGYSHTYPIGSSGHFEKIWIEADFDEKDDIHGNLQFLKREVEKFHQESGNGKLNGVTVKTLKCEDYFDGIYISQQDLDNQRATTQRERAAKNIIDQISSCTDVYILRSAYEKLANNYPEIQEAYNQKLKELTA